MVNEHKLIVHLGCLPVMREGGGVGGVVVGVVGGGVIVGETVVREMAHWVL